MSSTASTELLLRAVNRMSLRAHTLQRRFERQSTRDNLTLLRQAFGGDGGEVST